MSVNLSIKSVPEDLAETLRLRAARNHRSLQGELMAILEAAVSAAPVEAPAAVRAAHPAADRVRHMPRPMRGSKTIEQIAAAHRVLFPEPITGGPLAVDIIREMRDSR